MKIEYDEIYSKWVVWLVKNSAWIEMYRSKRKKDCKEFTEKKGKRDAKRIR